MSLQSSFPLASQCMQLSRPHLGGFDAKHGSFLGHPMTHISCPYALLQPPTAGDRTLSWRDLWSDTAHLVLHLGMCSCNFLAVLGKSSSVLLVWKASVPPKLLECQCKPREELQAGAVPAPHPSTWLQPLTRFTPMSTEELVVRTRTGQATCCILVSAPHIPLGSLVKWLRFYVPQFTLILQKLTATPIPQRCWEASCSG